MSVRPKLAVAALVLAATVAPVLAVEGTASDARNPQATAPKVGSPGRSASVAAGTNIPKGAYTSGGADLAFSNVADVSGPALRTINVWGARLDVPVR